MIALLAATISYPACLSDSPVDVSCTQAQDLDRLVQFVIPALAVVVLLVAIIAALQLRRSS